MNDLDKQNIIDLKHLYTQLIKIEHRMNGKNYKHYSIRWNFAHFNSLVTHYLMREGNPHYKMSVMLHDDYTYILDGGSLDDMNHCVYYSTSPVNYGVINGISHEINWLCDYDVYGHLTTEIDQLKQLEHKGCKYAILPSNCNNGTKSYAPLDADTVYHLCAIINSDVYAMLLRAVAKHEAQSKVKELINFDCNKAIDIAGNPPSVYNLD